MKGNSLNVPYKEEIFNEQVKVLYNQSKTSTIGIFFGPFLIALVFYDYLDRNTLLLWFLAIETAIIGQFILLTRYPRYPNKKKWVFDLTVLNTAFSTLAGVMGLILFLPDHPLVLGMNCIMLIGLGATMALTLASVQFIYILFIIPLFLPITISFFLLESLSFSIFGFVFISGIFALISINRNTYNVIETSIRLSLEKNDLVSALEQKRRAAEQEKANAEQANLLKTKFLAAASHDLRQPLHSMNLLLAILNDKNLNPEQTDLINKINISSESLTKLLDTLLDISRLDADTIEVNFTHFNLETLIQPILNDFIPIANQKNLILRAENYDRITAYSDFFHIDRILRNLVSNAIKFTESGEIKLSCQINCTNNLILSVSDTGPGIPISEQETIFQEFYQLNNPSRDRRQGLGLGLSIVRRLCYLLGSDIHLASTQQGSIFSFTLLCGEESQINIDKRPMFATPLNNTRILHIEDETEILQATEQLFTQWGGTVESATSLLDALNILNQKKYAPSVIISDNRLRYDQNGIDGIPSIKGVLKNPDLPVIILTGDTTPDVVRHCHQNSYLLLYKPIKPAKLLSAIHHCLDRLS